MEGNELERLEKVKVDIFFDFSEQSREIRTLFDIVEDLNEYSIGWVYLPFSLSRETIVLWVIRIQGKQLIRGSIDVYNVRQREEIEGVIVSPLPLPLLLFPVYTPFTQLSRAHFIASVSESIVFPSIDIPLYQW